VNILLAIDNSPHSQVAVDVLLNRVWPQASTFKVFCAVERREPVFAVMKDEEAQSFHNKALEAARQFTQDIAARLERKFPDCKVLSEAIFGDSKESILARVEEWPADLVVAGSHGRHGLPRLFLGSVSQTILLYSKCSTLIARYQRAHEGIPEFDKNILVAIDDTPHSKSALDWVLNMPWPGDACFSLLSVVPPLVDKYSDGIDALNLSKFSGDRVEVKKAAQNFLADSAERLKAKVGAKNVTVALREGDPAEVILFDANNWRAGLVVVGSRSRGHMTRFFLGSVSQEVVLQAPCPVEVVKRMTRV
jgi:nucleotide-binding universal stress UspA family protein